MKSNDVQNDLEFVSNDCNSSGKALLDLPSSTKLSQAANTTIVQYLFTPRTTNELESA